MALHASKVARKSVAGAPLSMEVSGQTDLPLASPYIVADSEPSSRIGDNNRPWVRARFHSARGPWGRTFGE